MKCAIILSLSILLTITSAFGQESVVPADAKLVSATPPLHMDRINCPVGLQVKHSPGLTAKRNANGPGSNEKSRDQDLDLTWTNLSPESIVNAQLVVHGFSNKWRYLPLSGADPDLATTVHVALDVKGNGQTSRSLSLNHFTAITAVDVNSITYADGSTWRTSSPGACSVSTDLFMLVNVER